MVLADDEPGSYKEVMASKNSEGWSASMNIEYNVLKEYHTWTLVEKLPNANIVGC